MSELKREFPFDFDWVLPLPGDWHTLYNFQPVLKKIFWDAGLSNLAAEMEVGVAMDTKGFRRNNHFFLQLWESMTRVFIKHFRAGAPQGYESAVAAVEELQNALQKGGAERAASASPSDEELERRFRTALAAAEADMKGLEADFMAWGEQLATVSKTWALWWRFVHHDMKAYVAFWLAVRSGNWDLRCAAYKKLAPIFRAYDRTHYQQLIPTHLANLLQWPEHVLDALRRGLWTVSLYSRPYRNFALDEAHESKINRDLKMSLARILGPESLVLQTNWLHKRGLIVRKVIEFVSKGLQSDRDDNPAAGQGTHRYSEINIQVAVAKLLRDSVLKAPPQANDPSSVKIAHLFEKKVATTQSQADLLAYREIGQELVLHFVRSSILGAKQKALKKQHLLGFVAEEKKKVRKVDKVKAEARRREVIQKRTIYSLLTNSPSDQAVTITNPIAQALFTLDGDMRKEHLHETPSRRLCSRHSDQPLPPRISVDIGGNVHDSVDAHGHMQERSRLWGPTGEEVHNTDSGRYVNYHPLVSNLHLLYVHDCSSHIRTSLLFNSTAPLLQY